MQKSHMGITVVFLNGSDHHKKNINILTSIKDLFHKCAEERGLQLRSLRFSLNGTTLFMSSLGGKTAKDLNWTFHNEITVTNIQEPCSETSTEPTKFAHQSSESIKESSKKKIHKAQNRSKPTLALDEIDDKLKETHSIELTKIFEEDHAIFKAIRQKLNNLTLDRKGPKTKSSSNDKNRDASTERDRAFNIQP